MKDIKLLSGIDSLYYFCQSNDNYSELFEDILDQIEEIKGKYEKLYIEYDNANINIEINNTTLNYLGRGEGFYWFRDLNEFYKIGFKKIGTNRGLHDIRVQLQANGIYRVGIKNLLQIINDELLDGYITDYFPVTRADLNCFIQYDLSFIKKEMFVTRKRKYSTISEIGNADKIQTIYIGKEPFKLRIYNKTLELKNSNKYDLMMDYFYSYGFSETDTIFNVEFQLNRTHLKTFKIDSVNDLLSNANNLFKQSMDEIRLIDLESIKDSTLKSSNKNRAITLPIWEHIKNFYNVDEFLQSDKSLARIQRKRTIYDDYKFKDEYVALLRKAFIHLVVISKDMLNEYYDEVKDSFNGANKNQVVKKSYIDVESINKDGYIEKQRLLKDGELITPVNVVTVSELGDYELIRYVEETKKVSHKSETNLNIYKVAYKEAMKRGLVL